MSNINGSLSAAAMANAAAIAQAAAAARALAAAHGVAPAPSSGRLGSMSSPMTAYLGPIRHHPSHPPAAAVAAPAASAIGFVPLAPTSSVGKAIVALRDEDVAPFAAKVLQSYGIPVAALAQRIGYSSSFLSKWMEGSTSSATDPVLLSRVKAWLILRLDPHRSNLNITPMRKPKRHHTAPASRPTFSGGCARAIKSTPKAVVKRRRIDNASQQDDLASHLRMPNSIAPFRVLPDRVALPESDVERRAPVEVPVHSLPPMAASAKEILVPISLDIRRNGIHIQDMFSWNLFEANLSPDQFAAEFCRDLQLDVAFQDAISTAIFQQLSAFAATLNKQSVAAHVPPVVTEAIAALRICTRRGAVVLIDKLEWDLTSPHSSVESVVDTICADMSLPLGWAPMIANAIHSQLALCRRALSCRAQDAAFQQVSLQVMPPVSSETAVRDAEGADEFCPILAQLTQPELDLAVTCASTAS